MTGRVTTVTATVIQASGGSCFYCGAAAKHAEHVVPKCEGGTDALENLVPACASCNAKKGKRRLPVDVEARALEYAANRAAWIRETGFEGCAGYMLRVPMISKDWSLLEDLIRRETHIVSKAEMLRRLIHRAHQQEDSCPSDQQAATALRPAAR